MANPEKQVSVWEMTVLIKAHADYVSEQLKFGAELHDGLMAALLRIRTLKNEILAVVDGKGGEGSEQ